MILVTVGTNEAPFDRLLHVVGELPPGEELIVQHGASSVRPARARCLDYVPFDELTELVRRARVVVTHAGVGSIMVVLASGKTPIVMPRLQRHGEAVDDHQVGLAERLAEQGLVTLVEDEVALVRAVAAHDGAAAHPRAQTASALAAELRAYLGAAIGAPTRTTDPRT